MEKRNAVLAALGGEASISDLKGASEALMGEDKITDYHLALIRSKNYAFIGGRQFTFFNNRGVADLFENVREGRLSRSDALSEMAIVLESFEGKTYFDHKGFSKRVKKHVSR